MPICVAVLGKGSAANQLKEKLLVSKTPISRFELVHPTSNTVRDNDEEGLKGISSKVPAIQSKGIEKIKLLNPKLARQARQSSMALWLMPFGFLAGLAFSQMTGLQTFEKLGVGNIGELLIGGILGMGSGWIGSYAAAGSINPDKENDLRTLRKFNEEGKWLLILETPLEIEMPWELIQEINPTQILRMREE